MLCSGSGLNEHARTGFKGPPIGQPIANAGPTFRQQLFRIHNDSSASPKNPTAKAFIEYQPTSIDIPRPTLY
jgi:hypothetical protein